MCHKKQSLPCKNQPLFFGLAEGTLFGALPHLCGGDTTLGSAVTHLLQTPVKACQGELMRTFIFPL